MKDLVAVGVDRQHAQDWLKVRKDKKAPLTLTAWDLVVEEAEKAGLSVAEAVRISAENSWAGFRASWMDKAKAEANAGGARLRLTHWTGCDRGRALWRRATSWGFDKRRVSSPRFQEARSPGGQSHG
ncbi:hypothetical protein WJ977_00560 [Achromobacter xylosoxidans]